MEAVQAQDERKMEELSAKDSVAMWLYKQPPYVTAESQKDPLLRGETLPMWAMRTGRFKIVMTLLIHSNHQIVANEFGRTPLMYGVLYSPEVGPDQVLPSLIMAFPESLASVDKNGDSALFLALEKGAVGHTKNLLLLGAPLASGKGLLRNKRGQTALDLARLSKNQELIALISQASKSEADRKAVQQSLSPQFH